MSETGDHRYEADVRWTTHGVAHVRAGSWGSLGFGQGWACARDHLAVICDQAVKVRSERARHHGRGPEDAHVASDLGYLALGMTDRAEALRAAQPPEVRDLVSGYVAGVNALLAATLAGEDGPEGPLRLPDWCAGAAWLGPLEEIDLYRCLVDVTLLASGQALVGLIGRAEAPDEDGPRPPAPMSALGAPAEGAGSNAWAFGGDVTASGGGVLLANPHFPWDGESRFWECHLTLRSPGAAEPELDVYGVCLIGAPGVQIGFNHDVAWSHTVSRGHRFTLARLDLVPGAPTRYRHGDDEQQMRPTTHRVEVRGDDGTLDTVERTLWHSHHGPMLNMPLLGWGNEVAFTYRDANIENTVMVSHFLAQCRARSMDELQRSYADIQGIPWVNTLAVDRTGRAWYADGSATPNLEEDAQRRFRDRVATDVVAALLYENRVALVDGSNPGDDWVEVPGARSPGLVPHSRQPRLERRDLVLNANDPHWLSSVAEPLEGYSSLHGFERTPQSGRTRQNHLVAGRLADVGGVTGRAVLDALFANEVGTAEWLCGPVVERARAARTVTIGDETVDLVEAAGVLDRWDRRCDLDSVGAALWRELLAGFAPADLLDAGPLYAVPFDPDDPVGTPRDLADPPDDGPDPVLHALGRAVLALTAADVPLDAPLGDVQWAARGDERIPVHGGPEIEGVANVLSPIAARGSSSSQPVPPRPPVVDGRGATSGLAQGGYPCTYGASIVMAVEMRPDGPSGVGLLAYGQSSDPASPHHVDGTRAYAAKEVRPLLFDDAAIEADPNLVRRTLTDG